MLLPLCAGGMVTGSCQKAWRKHGATSLWSHCSLPLHLCIPSVCPRHRSFVLSKWGPTANSCHSLPYAGWNSPHSRVSLCTLCCVDVFDYCLFGMEESQWVLLLFQLKIIIPDLDGVERSTSGLSPQWIWTWSLSLSPPHVTSLTTHPPFVPSPHTTTKDERKGPEGIGEGRREERKKMQKEAFAQHQNIKSILYFPTWLHGCCLGLPKYSHNLQRKILGNLNSAFGIQVDINKNKIYMGAGRDICPLLPICIRWRI